MASVEQLQVQGVRAFDPYRFENLRFGHPLTLIIGANGVGKTTIIECLLYAMAGELPGGKTGGSAFVQDPRISKSSQVMAQVKLEFVDVRGRKGTISRSMSATLRSGSQAPTFKTVDSQMVVGGHLVGGRETATARVADTNDQIVRRLGLPLAIQKYIVCCHQEDSLWPLSDPRHLKDRFDELFESSKYTKFLERVRVQRNELRGRLKLLEKDVTSLERDIKVVYGKREEQVELQRRVGEYTVECNTLQNQVDRDNHELKSLFEMNQQFQRVVEELKQNENTALRLEENIGLLGDGLDELSEPDEELTRALANNSEQSSLEQERKRLEEASVGLESRIKELLLERAQLANQMGRVESLEEAYQGAIATLNDTCKGEEPSHYERVLDEKVNEAQNAFERTTLANRQREDEIQRFLSSVEAESIQIQQTIRSGLDNIRELESKADDLSIATSGSSRVKYYAEQADDAHNELEKVRRTLKEFQSNSELAEAVNAVKRTQKAVEIAQRDLALATDRNAEENREKMLSDEIKRREKTLREILDAHPDISSIAQNLQTAKERYDSARLSLERARDQASEVEDLERQLKDYKPGRLADAETELEIATQSAEQTDFISRFYTAALQQARVQARCLLCEHTKTPKEKLAFENLLKSKLEAIPILPEVAAKRVEEARQNVDRARRLEPLSLRRAELPDKSNVDELKVLVDGISNEVRKLEGTQQAEADTFRLNSEIAELKSQVKPASQAMEPLESVRSRLRKAQVDRAASESQMEDLRDREATLHKRASRLAEEYSDARLQLSKAEMQEQEKSHQLQRLQEVQSSLNGEKSKVDAARFLLPENEKKTEAAKEELRSLKVDNGRHERTLVDERALSLDAKRAFDSIRLKVADLQQRLGENSIANLQDQIAASEKSVEGLQQELALTNQTLRQVDIREADNSRLRRQIMDTLQIRKQRSQLEITERRIEELKTQNAETARKDYESETRSIQLRISDAAAQIASRQGEVRQIERHLSSIAEELGDRYVTTESDLSDTRVRYQTTEAVCGDLDVYGRAVSSAITEFHSRKMREINRELDVLWRTTYTGSDIDTICIKSESEQLARGTSYRYRVVMRKGMTELDMRGRCSAGQKVLAAIIIRLALAECFGVECGLIVLDEPTTNLDRENANALAQSLSKIIESRSGQRNFQLIVITHDEHFLVAMNPAQYTSHYYRIDRDQRQYTSIRRMPINQLVES